MCSNTPFPIFVEIDEIKRKLEEDDELGPVVLGLKKRLEKQIQELEKYDVWIRENEDQYKQIMDKINFSLRILNGKIIDQKILGIRDNLEELRNEIERSLDNHERIHLAHKEGFLLNAEKEIINLKNSEVSEENKEKLEELQEIVLSIKQNIENYYDDLLDKMLKFLTTCEEFIKNFKGNRNDVTFGIFHAKLESCINTLRSINAKNHNSTVVLKKKKTVEVFENLRTKFNDKVYQNENTEIIGEKVDILPDFLEKFEDLRKSLRF